LSFLSRVRPIPGERGNSLFCRSHRYRHFSHSPEEPPGAGPRRAITERRARLIDSPNDRTKPRNRGALQPMSRVALP
jgi:hypothetical protein